MNNKTTIEDLLRCSPLTRTAYEKWDKWLLQIIGPVDRDSFTYVTVVLTSRNEDSWVIDIPVDKPQIRVRTHKDVL